LKLPAVALLEETGWHDIPNDVIPIRPRVAEDLCAGSRVETRSLGVIATLLREPLKSGQRQLEAPCGDER
jgi:hypothetical protein